MVIEVDIQEKQEDQLKPNKDGNTDFKFWESCPFCKLRRRIQKEIGKLRKN